MSETVLKPAILIEHITDNGVHIQYREGENLTPELIAQREQSAMKQARDNFHNQDTDSMLIDP